MIYKKIKRKKYKHTNISRDAKSFTIIYVNSWRVTIFGTLCLQKKFFIGHICAKRIRK